MKSGVFLKSGTPVGGHNSDSNQDFSSDVNRSDGEGGSGKTRAPVSLLDYHSEMKKKAETSGKSILKLFVLESMNPFLSGIKETDVEKKLKEEEKILESVAGRTGKYRLAVF